MREFLNQVLHQLGWPPELAFILWGVVIFAAVAVVGQLAVVFMVLMERKVLAWVTQRKGPNRVGPYGLLQTIADGVKLLFKEDIMNAGQDQFLFTMGPVIFLFPVFIVYLLLPFTSALVGIDLSIGLLFFFALSSLSVVGIVIAGWSSNNKYSLLGGMRSAAQAISYEIPLILSAMSVVLAAGSLNLKTIVETQNAGGFGLFSWYGLVSLPLGFIVFYIASIAEVNRIPFDLPEAESELVSGYNTEYSGMKFAMFFLAEYASLFAMSVLTVILFCGGYYSPIGGLLLEKVMHIHTPWLLQLEQATWLILKTYFFITVAMLIRGTLPRLKPDQLMAFSWKFLIPTALANLFLVATLKQVWLNHTMPLTLPVLGKVDGLYFVAYALGLIVILILLLLFGEIFKRKDASATSLAAGVS